MTPTVEPRTLPAPCRTVAEVPADAQTIAVHVDAAISAANCSAMVNLHALKLSATQASCDAIDAAIAMRSTGRDSGQLVGRWMLEAQAAFAEAARLGAEIPDRVRTDPVLAFAVSDSKFQLAPR